MTSGDTLIEHAADRLRDLSGKAAQRGGVAAKLAEPLAEDAAFLRKLKPSLIKARARGEDPAEPVPVEVPRPVSRPDGGGRNPLPLVAAALAAGVATAKLLDWRGHAHPRG